MQPSKSTDAVLSAAIRIQAELPRLVGQQDQTKLLAELSRLIALMQNSQDEYERQQVAFDLIDLLVADSATRELYRKLQMETGQTEIAGLKFDIMAELAEITDQLGEGEQEVAEILTRASEFLTAPSPTTTGYVRAVYIDMGGIGIAKTIKLKNFRLEIDQLSELAPGIALAAAEKVLPTANPLLVAAGVLLIVRSLVKAITVEIHEQEASVFWGLIQACDQERIASEEQIVTKTNSERRRIGLEVLKPNQIKASLHRLEALKTVQACKTTAHHWKILELYRVR